MSIISVKNVSFAYDGINVISGISFEVNQGDYICIVGENGAGKSTLIKGILGLKKPSSGRIIFENGLSSVNIGYLPQQSDIQRDFPASVTEVVISGRIHSLGMRPFFSGSDRKAAAEKIAMLGMNDMKKRCYRELSGGQPQRVLLARALCAADKVLLLDEPVAGLDPVMTAQFYETVAMLNREEKMTIIMVSHDVRSIISYATHILHIGGQYNYWGTGSDYKNTETGKFFLGGHGDDSNS